MGEKWRKILISISCLEHSTSASVESTVALRLISSHSCCIKMFLKFGFYIYLQVWIVLYKAFHENIKHFL